MSILTTADRFRFELEKLIASRIDHHMQVIARGVPHDYAEYLRVVGRVEGMKDVIELIEEAVHQLNYHEGEGKR
jgi:hypothetical protein